MSDCSDDLESFLLLSIGGFMADDLGRRQPEDPTKINVHQPWELNYWSKALGVTKQELVNAVAKVGPSVDAVKKFFGIR